MPTIPPVRSKQILAQLRSLDSPLPISNEREHLGREVRMVRPPKVAGIHGKIVRVITALRAGEKNPRNVGHRDVFYTIEVVGRGYITGVTWDDFLQVPAPIPDRTRRT